MTPLPSPDPRGSGRTRRRAVIALAAGALAALAVVSISACGPDTPLEARWAATHPSASATPSTEPGADPTATSSGGGGSSTTPGRTGCPSFNEPPPPVPMGISDGPSASWISAVATTQKVAFITIDDGFTKDPEFVKVLRKCGVRVSLFLEVNAIKDNPEYFRQLQAAGAVIEAHTLSHPELIGTSYAFQKQEICGSADKLGELYGRRPQLFRPPFGDKDATTLRVVHDCGMKAAFFWKETINAGIVRFQVGSKVQPGDIMLMHFRVTVVQDFIAGLWAIKDAGLTPALLEDYIPGALPGSTMPGATPTPTPTPTPTETPPVA